MTLTKDGRTWPTALLALALVGALAAAAPGPATAGGDYIVVLKRSAGKPSSVAMRHARRFAARPRRVFARALPGYVASVPRAEVARLRRDARVAFVEPDR